MSALKFETPVLLPVEAVVLLPVEDAACCSSVSMFWRSVSVAVPFATSFIKLLMSALKFETPVLLPVEAVVLLPVEDVVLLPVEDAACSSSVSMFLRSVSVAVPFATSFIKLWMSEAVVSLPIMGGMPAIPEELSCTLSPSELLSVAP
jgi:hypothetical protein